MSVQQEVNKYVRSHYGHLIKAGKPRFDEGTGVWVAELESSYPRVIRDDRSPDKPIVRFLHLRNLGSVQVSNTLSIVDATPRDKCAEAVSGHLAILKQRAERIMVQASSEQFAGLSEVRHVLSPVLKILNNLASTDKESPVIREIDLEGEVDQQKLLQYFKLLEGLDIVKESSGGYTLGNELVELSRLAHNNMGELQRSVLGYVIKHGYPALRSGFVITQIQPYIQVDNCYYWHAIEASKPLSTKKSTMRSRYETYYGRISPLSFNSMLRDLIEVNAIEEDGEFCHANEELLNEMVKMREDQLDDTSVSASTRRR
jgi:hypothetical protein